MIFSRGFLPLLEPSNRQTKQPKSSLQPVVARIDLQDCRRLASPPWVQQEPSRGRSHTCIKAVRPPALGAGSGSFSKVGIGMKASSCMPIISVHVTSSPHRTSRHQTDAELARREGPGGGGQMTGKLLCNLAKPGHMLLNCKTARLMAKAVRAEASLIQGCAT